MKKIWGRFLYPGIGWIGFSVALSVILLVYSLGGTHEAGLLDYTSYLFSAYTLAIVCLRIPAWAKTISIVMRRAAAKITTGNEKADAALRMLTNYDQRSRYSLNISLGLNLFYAVLKLGCGIWFRSVWMGALGVYYAVLAALRFSLLRSIGKNDEEQGRIAYRRIAWQLNLLTLVMSGIFVQMVIRNRTYSYPGVLIYAMAMWAFAKIITAAVNLIKRRREENKTLAAARCLALAEALMSILALQTAMIAEFGKGNLEFAFLMNSIGGAVVTALLITLSALMIFRSRERKET